MTKKTPHANGRINNNNEISLENSEFDRADTLNGNGDGLNSKNTAIDNFANFEVFSSTTTNDTDLFANNKFSSTQIDGHNILAKSRTSSTNAKDRFLGSLSWNDKSLNNNFEKKFASFVTNDTSIYNENADQTNADTKHQKSQRFDSGEDFADFSKTSFDTSPTLTKPCKSKSKTDCDTKEKTIPSKFQDDYSKTIDEFDTDLQDVLKRSLVDQ